VGETNDKEKVKIVVHTPIVNLISRNTTCLVTASFSHHKLDHTLSHTLSMNLFGFRTRNLTPLNTLKYPYTKLSVVKV